MTIALALFTNIQYLGYVLMLLVAMSLQEVYSQVFRGLGNNRAFVAVGIISALGIGVFNYVVSPIAGHFGLAVYSWLWLSIPLLILISWIVNRYFTRPLFAAIKRKVQHGQGG